MYLKTFLKKNDLKLNINLSDNHSNYTLIKNHFGTHQEVYIKFGTHQEVYIKSLNPSVRYILNNIKNTIENYHELTFYNGPIGRTKEMDISNINNIKISKELLIEETIKNL